MNTIEETTTLILAGSGYELAIAPAAEKRKADLLEIATAVRHVRDNSESAEAQYHLRNLAAMRIEVEKSRKAIKEPVIRIGKLIESTAANFVAELVDEEKRIAKLVGDHAEEVARAKAEAERVEREAFEAARAAREASEITGDESIADEALVARLQASNDLASTKVADGVTFAWDFEVEDIRSVYRAVPEFVDMTIRRSAVLTWLRDMAEADDDVAGKAALAGITAFKRAKVSTR